MKSKLLLIILLITAISYGQNVNIPDANLKTALLASYDTNNDGEIQVAEATAASNTLTLDGTGTVDLTGIETFINVSSIEILNENNITGGLDLSSFTAINGIRIWATSLTSIIFAPTTQGASFIANPDLQTIDTSNASGLRTLSIENAAVTSLDLSQNSFLLTLAIGYAPVNTITWGSKNLLYKLSLYDTALSGYLDFSDFTTLKDFYLELSTSNITGLNIANGINTNFTRFNVIGNTTLTCIQVDDVTYSTDNWTNIPSSASFSLNCPNTSLSIQDVNTISDLKVYPNPVKNILNINTIEDVKKVEIYNTIGNKVIDTNATKINMGALSTGLYILKIHTNSGKTGIRRFIKSN